MISISSLVMTALTRTLYSMVRSSIISPAFRVALSMADIRAPCSEAAFSSRAEKIAVATPRGSRFSQNGFFAGLVVEQCRRLVRAFGLFEGSPG